MSDLTTAFFSRVTTQAEPVTVIEITSIRIKKAINVSIIVKPECRFSIFVIHLLYISLLENYTMFIKTFWYNHYIERLYLKNHLINEECINAKSYYKQYFKT